MREVHIGSPIWNGLRTETFLGIARFRLVDGLGKPFKGNIKIWVDYKIKDKNDPEGNMIPMWKNPFTIPCAKAIGYPIQVLADYHKTRLHIIPTKDLKIHKEKRKRTMTQDDFNSLKMASLAVKKENDIKAQKDDHETGEN